MNYEKMNPRIGQIFALGFTGMTSYFATALFYGLVAFHNTYFLPFMTVLSGIFCIHSHYTLRKILKARESLLKCR